MTEPRVAKVFRLVLPMTLLLSAGEPPGALAGTGPEGLWLVTPEEAMTPGEVRSRGLFQREAPLPNSGPDIRIEKPGLDQAQQSPLDIAINFLARRAPVDLATLKVTLVKLVNIDLTERVRQYVSPEGLRVPKVNLPSGEHIVRLSLGDQAGGVTVKEIILDVR